MSKVVFFNSYKLKKGASVPDFLAAVEQLNNEHISKQKGYETWADASTFETMEDAKILPTQVTQVSLL